MKNNSLNFVLNKNLKYLKLDYFNQKVDYDTLLFGL